MLNWLHFKNNLHIKFPCWLQIRFKAQKIPSSLLKKKKKSSQKILSEGINSLVVQWLGLCTFHCKGESLIPGCTTKIPQPSQQWAPNPHPQMYLKSKCRRPGASESEPLLHRLPCHCVVVWPWASYLISLEFYFPPFCKLGVPVSGSINTRC